MNARPFRLNVVDSREIPRKREFQLPCWVLRRAMSEVTRLLEALDRGEPRAAEDLLPLVYEELRRLAHQKMAREKPGQTLQATALVHEAWLNLVAPDQPHWKGRAHFFGAAAEAMRRILIANARRKRREKRGAGWERIPLEEIEVADQADPETLSRGKGRSQKEEGRRRGNAAER
jgi:RNA polymerase sigma factor (TIGR02999 family)